MDSSPQETDHPSTMNVSRKDLFVLLKGKLNENASIILDSIEQHVSTKTGRPFTLSENDKPWIRKFLHEIRSKWQKVARREDIFLEKYKDWLSTCHSLQIESSAKTPVQKGRPPSDFLQLSERAKRRRTENIRSEVSAAELAFATQMSLRASGNVEAAKVVKDVGLAHSSTAEKYRRSLEFVPESQMSADEALSVFLEQKLSKGQYQGLRNAGLRHKCKLFPPYRAVSKAKLDCYPSRQYISVTESSAEVQLQSLLDHTVGRILLSQKEVVKNLTSESVGVLKLIAKWGCDGSSGQSNYKQSFSDDSISDSSIFLTSLVPLQLLSSDQLIIWKNPRPSSPRYCRPIHIQFLHENVENTVKETENIQEQQKNLIPYKTVIDGKAISVHFDLALTMIDSKVCNAITGTSSTQRCNICGATSKKFNDIDSMVQNKVIEKNLQYGISSLHAWIRFFECCLHVSYKLEVKKWQVRDAEEKTKVESRKKNIQEGFRKRLGLIVDQPKHGYGSSNDGNTARRFFEHHDISSLITGIDEDLIKRFYIILQTISSGHDVNLVRFEEYSLATARKFVDLYPWYYMPTSVHKLLIHGAEIISSALLPIGQMSEDAQESCNKYIKRFREDFARKHSRAKTMEDIFLRLLASSDPLITGLRKLPQKKLRNLFPETLEMLIPPSVSPSCSEAEDSESAVESSTDCDESSDSD